MKIYLTGMFESPSTDRLMALKSVAYAYFSALGTWVSEREPCKVCGWHWQSYGPPLLVQWEPSTDIIGDFSWDGPFGYTFVVKESIAARLATMDFACDFLPVKYVKPERKLNTVPFPYKGPKLLWAECRARVELDMVASNVELESSCPECGDVRYSFRYRNIVIRRRDWKGEKIFRIRTNCGSSATFVAEIGRELIERAGFTNIAFSEAGEIVE